MVILGIDPGTAATGWGVIKKQKGALANIAYGCVVTSKHARPQDRLLLLEQELQKILKTHKPQVIVVERLYFFKNLKTALPVSEARGIILLQAAKHKVSVKELTPLQAKMAITGYGRAEKLQVQRMVQNILGLSSLPKPDDAADALALAIAQALAMKTR